MTARPPRVVLWLLRRLLPADQREPFVGDVLEEFRRRTAAAGLSRARWWLWRESLVALLTLRARRTVPAIPTSGDPPLLSFLGDLHHATRLLRRAPAFTTLAVLTLALGIGATAAIFSVVNPVLFRPLPYPSPDRVVVVWERGSDGLPSNVGFSTFLDFARARSLEYAAALGDWQVTLSGQGAPERVSGQRVSATYFGVLGVRPALGRDFTAEEDAPGKNRVVILGHGLWQRRFGGDSALVGRPISIDGNPYTVVGVLPASFDNVVDPNAQIWRVLGYSTSLPWACRTCRHLRMIGRMRPQVTLASAAAELDHLSALVVKDHPRDYPAVGTRVVSLQDDVTRASRPVLFALLGAVTLVLLIAAANVVNLQLARAMRRDEEFAIRVALGAGRVRLTKQLLAEGLLLALLAGVAGALVARLILSALLTQIPPSLPRLSAIRLDLDALMVSAALTLVLGVVIGLVPGWRSGGHSTLASALRGSRRLTGHGRHVARSALVIAEVALAMMLLVGATLLARSLVRLLSVDAGFEAAHLLTMQVQSTGPRYADSLAVYTNHDLVRAAVRGVPGVVGVGTANQLPLGGNIDSYGIGAEDKPLANPELAPYADRYAVSPDYMTTMRIPIRRGRSFTDADNRDSMPRVAIVSAALAAKIWPGEDVIGKRIRLGDSKSPWRTVIGVAGNVHHRALDSRDTDQIYIPERQWQLADDQIALVVRTSGDPAAVAAAVRRAVQAVDMSQPITRLETMDQVITASTAQRRLALLLFFAFAGVAIVLAAAGIYGVLAGAVTERTREIGLRSALGATPVEILRLILLQGARLAAVGLVAGVAGAIALGRFLESLLFGVAPSDPVTLVAVSAMLAAVALAACLLPAMRAVGVDPMTALRAD